MYIIRFFQGGESAGVDSHKDINKAKELARLYVDKNWMRFAEVVNATEIYHFSGTKEGYNYKEMY